VLERDEACAIARIDVSYKGMKSSFTTRNELTPNQQIHMTLIEGPFSALEGKWLFDSLDEVACRVSLAVEFAFSSRLIEKTMAPVFTHICGDLIDAFAGRAEQVHGERRFA
jgi:ribosome-associated toxin RatA of RatAB toxin-antitoxin module